MALTASLVLVDRPIKCYVFFKKNHLLIERQTTVLEAPPGAKGEGNPAPPARPQSVEVFSHSAQGLASSGGREGVLPKPRVRRGKEEGVWGALSGGRQGGRRKKTVAGR